MGKVEIIDWKFKLFFVHLQSVGSVIVRLVFLFLQVCVSTLIMDISYSVAQI